MQNIDQAWYDSETPATDVTMEEFEELCEAIVKQREVYEEKKKAASAENSRLEDLEMKMIRALQVLDRPNYKSRVGLFSRVRKESWALPKGEEDRTAFFNYLKQEGTFEGMITVHSATFNSYMKEKLEKAQEEGNSAGFSIPGVGEPAVFENLRLVKGK